MQISERFRPPRSSGASVPWSERWTRPQHNVCDAGARLHRPQSRTQLRADHSTHLQPARLQRAEGRHSGWSSVLRKVLSKFT